MARIYTLILIVMAAWGFNVSAVFILVENIDPITLTAFRVFTAGLAVLLMAMVLGIFRLPTKSEWKTLCIIAIFNVILHHSFLGVGLTKTSGVNASIILGSAPLITMVLSIIFLKEYVTTLRKLGFILGFIGIIVTSLAGAGDSSGISMGDLYILLSITAQSLSFIFISKLNPNFDPRLITGYMLIFGSVFIFILGLSLEGNVTQLGRLFSWDLGLIFLFSAIIATAFGHMTYNYAIKNVGPTETTIFVNLNTLFAILGAAIFLGESIVAQHYIGLVLIILGVLAGSGTLGRLLEKRRLSP